jgi:hypothetical protein
MKAKQAVAWLAGGLLLGVVLALNIGADEAKPKQDWSKIQMVTYSSGLTGFFDPAAGKLYLYDANIEKCFMVRELTTLGEPMKRLQN